jgi:hypothetical protein
MMADCDVENRPGGFDYGLRARPGERMKDNRSGSFPA